MCDKYIESKDKREKAVSRETAQNKMSTPERFISFCLYSLQLFFLVSSLVACSLSEEMKRIEESKQYEEREDASRSSDLTGEQVFIRSCNTCHPGGKQGMGPSLINISKKYSTDGALRSFIRRGRGIMPAQPVNVINDIEMSRLVEYVKALKE